MVNGRHKNLLGKMITGVTIMNIIFEMRFSHTKTDTLGKYFYKLSEAALIEHQYAIIR